MLLQPAFVLGENVVSVSQENFEQNLVWYKRKLKIQLNSGPHFPLLL